MTPEEKHWCREVWRAESNNNVAPTDLELRLIHRAATQARREALESAAKVLIGWREYDNTHFTTRDDFVSVMADRIRQLASEEKGKPCSHKWQEEYEEGKRGGTSQWVCVKCGVPRTDPLDQEVTFRDLIKAAKDAGNVCWAFELEAIATAKEKSR